ncbi:MAG: cupin domain-containing protein [Nitrospirae bacterium]|nr:cupin domain-containing protein [Nitrospirota bacterium]MBI5696780.1 cupin domain-containing protein [Nitrospirota bacterium]
MQAVEIKKLAEGFHDDPRTGWAAWPFLTGFGEGGADIRAVHVVAIMPGQVRGNHYHEKAKELLFMFSGTGMLYWEEDGHAKERLISGEPVIVTIPPGVKHAFRNTGEDTVYLIAVRDGDYDPAHPDTVRSVIQEG